MAGRHVHEHSPAAARQQQPRDGVSAPEVRLRCGHDAVRRPPRQRLPRHEGTNLRVSRGGGGRGAVGRGVSQAL